MRILLALALAILAAPACSSSGTAPLALSWRFADGRSCADASVFTVAVEGVSDSLACGAGHEPAAVTITVPRSGSLVVRALSGQSVELYRGTLSLDGLIFPVEGADAGAATTTVTLYATGSR